MKEIKILHLFPRLMSLYGEYGNLKVLASRLRAGGYEVTVTEAEEAADPRGYDLVYVGSGTEDNLVIAARRLEPFAEAIRASMAEGTLWLATGNAPGLFGRTLTRNGEALPHPAVFEYDTDIRRERFLGDVLTAPDALTGKESLGFVNSSLVITGAKNPLLTFRLGESLGNDKKSAQDGMLAEGYLATGLIGPFLVKNPHFMGYVYEKLTGTPMEHPVDHLHMAYEVSHRELTKRLESLGK